MPTPIPNTWLTCPPAVYYDILTHGDANSAEAAYYLLRHRLSKRLAKVFDAYGFGLIDDYNDTIDDFFLYLHGLDGRIFSAREAKLGATPLSEFSKGSLLTKAL